MSERYTLNSLFERFPKGICVPCIQRGYVQGREDKKGCDIRKSFPPALVNAVFGGDELSLDFIYGVAADDKDRKEVLLPLDGQQRLSTLLLLAWLCNKWDPIWCFTYESRRIPQLFMKGLQEHPRSNGGQPSTEIEETGWFLPIWKNDPSVAGMLRMLDTLHEAIGQRKRENADFGRISFLLHGIDGDSDTFDHIFRKMNARGKELSPWENMKAMLDKYVQYMPKSLTDGWRDKIDGDWAECIWRHTDYEITKLDNAMEKIIRMAYARFVRVEAQNASLWQIENKLMVDADDAFDEATCTKFYQTTAMYFDALPTVAKFWTDKRTHNALWEESGDEADFWQWLTSKAPASAADLLRMAVLAENANDGDKDKLRRQRILLNLLDASSIDKDNFTNALDAALGFLSGKVDLSDFNTRKAGYSTPQLEDEIRKLMIDEKEIISIEKDELVCKGSLRFIGWTQFCDATDIRKRLESIRAAINGDKWLDFYQNLVSRIPQEKFRGRYAYTPLRAGDAEVWREKILPDDRFIDALREWNDAPDATQIPPVWMQHLVELFKIDQVHKSTLRCWDNWMFLLQREKYRGGDSIRLDRNENEREHRQLLRDGQIYYTAPWPWAAAKEDGVLYNVCDPSWSKSDAPPKGRRDTDGDICFVDLKSETV